MKKVILAGAALLLIAAGVVYGTRGANGKSEGGTRVRVERGAIVDKALATGRIVPREEVQVKSQISGIVRACYVEVGDEVREGERLFEIAPNPTPLERTEAERNVQLAEIACDRSRLEHDRRASLLEDGLISQEEYDAARKQLEGVSVERDLAVERLALIKEGKIRGSRAVDSVIRAPASGTVLERLVDPGEPVVPLTSFQEGTALLTIADMNDLVFKWTVDEIDVGKLEPGLPVRIRVGALPNAEIEGKVVRIAPKAREEQGTTLFSVEASIEEAGGALLRAGYSANADVVIREKVDVLLLPERVVSFEGEKAFVELPPPRSGVEPERRAIEVGLSDGLQVEVLSGLEEGDEVWQRPPKEIE